MAKENKTPEDKSLVAKEKKAAEDLIVAEAILTAAERYQQAASLPPEARTSVINMVKNLYGLLNLVRYQRRLKPEKRRSLVSTSPGRVITDAKLREIDDFVKMNCIPYNCLYLTKDGNIAVKAMGWRLKAQADPRCIKGFENVRMTVEERDGVTTYTCEGDLVFWTGERYHASGSASTDEDRATRTPHAHLRMIAETRMQTRAMRLAIGLPYEVAEDVAEVEAIEVSAQPVSAPGELKSAADLLARAFRELGLRRNDILRILGVGSLGEITDFDKAWEDLIAASGSEEGSSEGKESGA